MADTSLCEVRHARGQGVRALDGRVWLPARTMRNPADRRAASSGRAHGRPAPRHSVSSTLPTWEPESKYSWA